MYQDKRNEIGEHSSVAEELLSGVPELELKCKAVLKSTKAGYYSVEKAMQLFKVKPAELLSYLILKNIEKLEKENVQSQYFDLVTLVTDVYASISKDFDKKSQSAFVEIERISDPLSSGMKILK